MLPLCVGHISMTAFNVVDAINWHFDRLLQALNNLILSFIARLLVSSFPLRLLSKTTSSSFRRIKRTWCSIWLRTISRSTSLILCPNCTPTKHPHVAYPSTTFFHFTHPSIISMSFFRSVRFVSAVCLFHGCHIHAVTYTPSNPVCSSTCLIFSLPSCNSKAAWFFVQSTFAITISSVQTIQ